jgi:hypothetical protein
VALTCCSGKVASCLGSLYLISPHIQFNKCGVGVVRTRCDLVQRLGSMHQASFCRLVLLHGSKPGAHTGVHLRAVWSSVEQCGAVWSSVEQCGAVWSSVEQCGKPPPPIY